MSSSTGLWQDMEELPASLASTLDRRDGFVETAALLGAGNVRRIVATGNGAAYYVAVALWLASLESTVGPEVVAVPSGLVAKGAFRWRSGDVLLAISSSGEFRDLVEAVESGAPSPYAAITSTPESTLGAGAGARAVATVLHQRAVTHTQAFCGNVAVALSLWSAISGDPGLAASLNRLPDELAAGLPAVQAWAARHETLDPSFALVLGSGAAWAAALEAALLLREVAGIPSEGAETREAATTSMMALAAGHLALSLPAGDDGALAEAERVCAVQGAQIIRAPVPGLLEPRLTSVTTFPAAVALAEQIGLARGLNVDDPSWADAYYTVARSSTT